MSNWINISRHSINADKIKYVEYVTPRGDLDIANVYFLDGSAMQLKGEEVAELKKAMEIANKP